MTDKYFIKTHLKFIDGIKIYSNSILALGISGVLYVFFSLYGLINISEYEAWLILAFAISPYVSLGLLKLAANNPLHEGVALAFASTTVSLFGFYWYWIALAKPGSEQTGLIFIFTPVCQLLFVLSFIVLLWIINILKKQKIQ